MELTMLKKSSLIGILGLITVLVLSAFTSVSSNPAVGNALSLANRGALSSAALVGPDVRAAHIFDLAQASAALVGPVVRAAHIFDLAQSSASLVSLDVRAAHIFDLAQARATVDDRAAHIFDLASY
jgi:hypothetical protein